MNTDLLPKIVLASTSPFRAQLLEKLGLPFETASPDIDEKAYADEAAQALVARLAESKARHVAGRYPNALIIGSDQVACIDDRILGKPGNRSNAIKQLQAAAGKTVVFHTGLCLHNTNSSESTIVVEPFEVRFRALSLEQITRYVDRETPFNCAGSFKSEGYGITLFDALEGRDPNTLIGLPLIALTHMLNDQGFELP